MNVKDIVMIKNQINNKFNKWMMVKNRETEFTVFETEEIERKYPKKLFDYIEALFYYFYHLEDLAQCLKRYAEKTDLLSFADIFLIKYCAEHEVELSEKVEDAKTTVYRAAADMLEPEEWKEFCNDFKDINSTIYVETNKMDYAARSLKGQLKELL